MHLYGKNVQYFKQLLIWSLWANFAQISFGASLGWGNEKLLKWSRSVDQVGRHAHIWKKPLKIFSSRTKNALGLNLCRNHRGREVYQQQGLFWPKIFVREKIPFGQKQWEIFKFSEIFFSLARTNWVRFFFFFFFVKARFCIRIVYISIIIAYFVMYSKSG